MKKHQKQQDKDRLNDDDNIEEERAEDVSGPHRERKKNRRNGKDGKNKARRAKGGRRNYNYNESESDKSGESDEDIEEQPGALPIAGVRRRGMGTSTTDGTVMYSMGGGGSNDNNNNFEGIPADEVVGGNSNAQSRRGDSGEGNDNEDHLIEAELAPDLEIVEGTPVTNSRCKQWNPYLLVAILLVVLAGVVAVVLGVYLPSSSSKNIDEETQTPETTTSSPTTPNIIISPETDKPTSPPSVSPTGDPTETQTTATATSSPTTPQIIISPETDEPTSPPSVSPTGDPTETQTTAPPTKLEATSQSPQHFFCGSNQPCLIQSPISCETFVNDYEFQGSCCSLQPIPSIGGCRIEVYGGNCFWTPICGECDPKAECYILYESGLQQSCPPSDYDPFNLTNKQTCPPTTAPFFSFDEQDPFYDCLDCMEDIDDARDCLQDCADESVGSNSLLELCLDKTREEFGSDVDSLLDLVDCCNFDSDCERDLEDAQDCLAFCLDSCIFDEAEEYIDCVRNNAFGGNSSCDLQNCADGSQQITQIDEYQLNDCFLLSDFVDSVCDITTDCCPPCKEEMGEFIDCLVNDITIPFVSIELNKTIPTCLVDTQSCELDSTDRVGGSITRRVKGSVEEEKIENRVDWAFALLKKMNRGINDFYETMVSGRRLDDEEEFDRQEALQVCEESMYLNVVSHNMTHAINRYTECIIAVALEANAA